jgi:hypothetical protein
MYFEVLKLEGEDGKNTMQVYYSLSVDGRARSLAFLQFQHIEKPLSPNSYQMVGFGY